MLEMEYSGLGLNISYEIKWQWHPMPVQHSLENAYYIDCGGTQHRQCTSTSINRLFRMKMKDQEPSTHKNKEPNPCCTLDSDTIIM